MLTERYPPERLSGLLTPPEDYRPFPTADEREPWEAIPDSIREAHLKRAQEASGNEWPMTPATVFLDYARNGNRSRYQDLSFKRRSMLAGLVLGECVAGDGRFLDPIADGIWCICEETYWGVPAHIWPQEAGVDLPDVTEPTVDLFAAETAALLAWTHYLLGEKLDMVSKLLRPRIEYEIERRILTTCLEREYRWMGLYEGAHVNNWNPWICSNWLTCALLLERDAERRAQTISRILKCVDVFIDGYPQDGGCDEGPGYWNRAGAALFDCLELLHGATNGEIHLYDEPVVKNMGRFIYRVHIAGRWLVNFADGGARGCPSPSLVFEYGKRIGDDAMADYGAFCGKMMRVGVIGFPVSLGRALPALASARELLAAEARQPLPRDAWLPDTQVMIARSDEGRPEGFFLAAKGGHNQESHNHNDVGQFIVFRDGKPLLIDIGVETYTRKTFSEERYSIWAMQSAWHNLPTVNGVMQAPGREYAARDLHYHADDTSAHLDLDIAAAYPEEAGIISWRRTFTLDRDGAIEVEDEYELRGSPQSLSFALMTPCEVSVRKGGEILLSERQLPGNEPTGTAALHYETDKLSAFVEEVAIADPGLGNVWGECLFRITLRPTALDAIGRYLLRVTP